MGLRNYIQLIRQNRFVTGMKNTFSFTIITTLMKNVLGFGIAIALNQKLKTKNILRAVYYLPVILSTLIVAEIFRAGILAVDKGQTEAARSLGLSQTQNLRYIIFPQALKNILPAIANEFVVIIKESAITYTIGVQDIMSAVNAVKGATFIIVEPLLVATAIYFCLCFPTSKIIAYFERRMSRGDKR